eukprot:6196855-Pyramimonas_sp.AAC.1
MSAAMLPKALVWSKKQRAAPACNKLYLNNCFTASVVDPSMEAISKASFRITSVASLAEVSTMRLAEGAHTMHETNRA